MPPARVQSWSTADGTTSATASYLTAPAAGNLLIACGRCGTRITAGTITGWTEAAGVPIGTGPSGYAQIFYKIAVGDEQNVTVSYATGTSSRIAISEYSDVDTLDKIAENGSLGSDTSVSTGTTANTTRADTLAIALAAVLNSVTYSGWTNSFVSQARGTDDLLMVSHKILTTVGAVETTASWTTARGNAACVATFYLKTYIKTINSITRLKEKAINGTAIASVKSINGITN